MPIKIVTSEILLSNLLLDGNVALTSLDFA